MRPGASGRCGRRGRRPRRSAGRSSTSSSTGDPLFSLNYTSDSAEDLGRAKTLGEVPGRDPRLPRHDRQAAGDAGRASAGLRARVRARRRAARCGRRVLLASRRRHLRRHRRRRAERDRALPRRRRARRAVFAAVAVGGLDAAASAGRAAHGVDGRWPGVARRVRRASSPSSTSTCGASTTSCASAATRTTRSTAILDEPRGAATRCECGPLTLPNHKLVPDARWVADLPFERVRSRVQEARAGARASRSSSLGRFAIFKQAWTNELDPARVAAAARRLGRSSPAPTTMPPMRAARRLPARRSARSCCSRSVLRLWGTKTGLPYVYNVDEGAHFVPRAIGMFDHSYDPGYFINPPGADVPLPRRCSGCAGAGTTTRELIATDPTAGLRCSRASRWRVLATRVGRR